MTEMTRDTLANSPIQPFLNKQSSVQDKLEELKVKAVRTRSSSSPVKQPLAQLNTTRLENLATYSPVTEMETIKTVTPDTVLDTFLGGLDKWNGIFKNAMVSEFMLARKQLMKYQSELDKKEKQELLKKVKELEVHLAQSQATLASLQFTKENVMSSLEHILIKNASFFKFF
jgi:hypothetical protein